MGLMKVSMIRIYFHYSLRWFFTLCFIWGDVEILDLPKTGPQWLASPDGSWRGIVYSCAGSWTKDYKMNTLRLLPNSDPLDPSSWQKGHRPLIQNSQHGHGPWGPGHGCFLDLGSETVGVYHATDGPGDGWENRRARCQRVAFGPDGPSMGGQVGPLSDIKAFMGGQGEASSQGKASREKKHGFKGFMQKLRDEL